MNISLSQAKAQLTELVRRAEQGEDVVLTRRGRAVARISSIRRPRLSPEERGRVIDEIVEAVRAKNIPPQLRTSNHDEIYDDLGLPK